MPHLILSDSFKQGLALVFLFCSRMLDVERCSVHLQYSMLYGFLPYECRLLRDSRNS